MTTGDDQWVHWKVLIGSWSLYNLSHSKTNRIPGTGSFTRPSPNIQVGQSLLEILKERYVDDELTAEDLYLGETNVKVDVYDFERVKKKNRYLIVLNIFVVLFFTSCYALTLQFTHISTVTFYLHVIQSAPFDANCWTGQHQC
jgi:hypothetical protein